MIGRQCRRSWEAIASSNPLLEDVVINASLVFADFGANGLFTGELQTIRWGFGEEDRGRRDELYAKSFFTPNKLPFDIVFDGDNDGFSLQRFQYDDDSEIVYFGLGRVVTEQEILDIVEPFSVCPGLRVLELHDKDEDAPWESTEVTCISPSVRKACIPFAVSQRFCSAREISGNELHVNIAWRFCEFLKRTLSL